MSDAVNMGQNRATETPSPDHFEPHSPRISECGSEPLRLGEQRSSPDNVIIYDPPSDGEIDEYEGPIKGNVFIRDADVVSPEVSCGPPIEDIEQESRGQSPTDETFQRPSPLKRRKRERQSEREQEGSEDSQPDSPTDLISAIQIEDVSGSPDNTDQPSPESGNGDGRSSATPVVAEPPSVPQIEEPAEDSPPTPLILGSDCEDDELAMGPYMEEYSST